MLENSQIVSPPVDASQSSLAVKFSWGTNQKGTEGGLVDTQLFLHRIPWTLNYFFTVSYDQDIFSFNYISKT